MTAVDIRETLRYTADHEWVGVENDQIRIGITDFAQEALGDVVYIALPKTGQQLKRGDVMGEVESTKSVSEVYAPVGGEVVEVNTNLDTSPEQVNSEPYDGGWICVIRPSEVAELDELLDAEAYRTLVTE